VSRNTPQERRDKWKALIEEQEQSDLSQDAFCKLHNLSFSNFTYYRRQFQGKHPVQKKVSGTFSPVSLAKASSTNEIRLSLPNGFQCSFPIDITTARIKEIVGVFLSC